MINKTIKLNNDLSIPTLGLGTWKAIGQEVSDAVYYAIAEAGYRHIDCASIYLNEEEIGETFNKLFKLDYTLREKVFITSKLWNNAHRKASVLRTCKQTLKDLKLDYLDLYLMHWGIATAPEEDLEPVNSDGYLITDNVPIQETWQAMEELIKMGLVKSIGVANFTTPMLVDLLTYAKIKPVMNQIELHPYFTQEELVEFCKYKDIAVTAYSPLGRPGRTTEDQPVLIEDKKIVEIAKTHNKTPAQVLLNWAIERGTIPIPKSVNPKRIKENIDVFDFELSDEEIQRISSLNKNYRFVNPTEWWKIPYFS